MREIVFQPLGKRAEFEPGTTILQAAQAAGVSLAAVCGGVGVCGDCRVRVLSGTVSAPNLTEEEWLDGDEIAAGFRLACQVVITGDEAVLVDVPPESLSVMQRSQVEGEETAFEVAPTIRIHDLVGAPPTIHDLRGDWERIVGVDPGWRVPASVLAAIPGMLRAHDWHIRLVMRGSDVVHVLPPGRAPLGFAVDVGTTGLAAYLIDLESGETLGIAGTTNPQIAYGEDVMARLTLVMRDPAGAQRLQSTVIEGLNGLLRALCEAAEVVIDDVVDVVAVGNTAMHHLLLGLPVEQLGSAPYVPAVASAVYTSARDLGLDVAAGAELYLPPNLAGFVGGDHTAMLLATGTLDQPGITLSLDIGTNTEVTLNANGQRWTCSTASGPAFEGAHIRDGMRAADGAIERLMWHDGALTWLTINQARPVGLCGSGILDAVAALRAAGILSATGRMTRDHPAVRRVDRDTWFEIVPAGGTGHGRAVVISRGDVSEVQLAKSAIRAGIKLLTERAGIAESDIDRVIVAGAFGSYIDIENAIAIGMFPPLPVERFRQVGNAAGIGAKRLLLDARARQRAAEIAGQLEYIELTDHPDFKDRFSQAVVLDPEPWQ